MATIPDEELAQLRLDAARFQAEQHRAWLGLPEYTVATDYQNDNDPKDEAGFKARRAAHIDSTFIR